MAINCCRGCVAPKRHTACWGHCPEYLAEKAEYDRKKSEYDRKQAIDMGLYLQRSELYHKAMKKRRRKDDYWRK